jgi:MSHA biogenesis protein MshE
MSEVSLLLDKPHSHLARATLSTRLVRIKKPIFSQLLLSGQFCINLGKRLSLRLQKSTDSTALKMFDVAIKVNPAELAHLIPRQIIIQQQVMPLRLIENEITLGTVNPGNDAIYSIANRYLRGLRIKLELITLENFTAWSAQIPSSEVALHRDRNAGAKSAPVSAITELNKLLADGFDRRASDLHVEPTPTGYCIRYRIDGVLTEIGSKIPSEAGESIVNRIKVVSNLDITNRQTPQDGQLKIVDGNRTFTARVATFPTRTGDGAVLRLIRERNAAVPLTMLAPDIRTIGLLRSIAKFKQGLFLVTGPTGSGKTTTLYSIIAELNKVDTKVISIEDPIELEIAGTTQIEINEKTDMTFARALKSTLRQDPDILVVGEIRDADAAKVVFDAAMAGHLIISTLHTNNALSVKNRLKELGVPLGSISAGLIGAMAQRLVRAICPKCRTSRPVTEEESKHLSLRLGPDVAATELFEGRGCAHCNNTGFHGRLPIMEIWKSTRGIADLLAADASSETLLAEAQLDSYKTLYEFGLRMAVNGLTTIKEVERCTAGQ